MAYEKTYTAESPEVVAYMEANPGLNADVAIDSIQDIHAKIVVGEEIPTPDNLKDVIGQISTMIQDWIIANPEVVAEEIVPEPVADEPVVE